MLQLIKKIKVKNIVILVLMGFLSFNLISAQVDLLSKKQQNENLKEQEEKLALEVDALQHLLDEEDEATYMERIARERLGYANPDERIFYDIKAK